MNTRQRHPADCPHRVKTGTAVACGLLADIVDLPAETCEVTADACDACCRFPAPAADAINPVIASLVSGAAGRLLESGHPRLNVQQLAAIQSRAWANLRAYGPDDPAERFEERELAPCCYLGEPRGGGEFDCRHPKHDVTTDVGCRWCRDWSQSPDGRARRRLVDLVPPPARRTSAPVRHWVVGVTTAPREQPTVGISIDSLIRAGWPGPVIFADGDAGLPERFGRFHTTRRINLVGAWPNYLLALQELLFAEPDADAYLLSQDDVVFCDGVDAREYLEDHILWPGESPAIVSLYCPTPYTRERNGWHVLEEQWVWGALAFVFPRDIARRIISDEGIHQHRWSNERNGKALIDVAIGEWAARNNVPVYYPIPSLTQHIGHVSTVFPGNHVLSDRRAARFADDELRGVDS